MKVQAMMTLTLAHSIQAHEWAARHGDLTLTFAAQEARDAAERLFILARPYFADETRGADDEEKPAPQPQPQPQPQGRDNVR